MRKIAAATLRRIWTDNDISLTEAARRAGMSDDALRARAKAIGLPRRRIGPEPAILPHQYAEFADMWEAGVSEFQLAAHFGCRSRSPIATCVRRLGLPKRKRGAPRLDLAAYRLKMLTDELARSAAETRAAVAASWARQGEGA